MRPMVIGERLALSALLTGLYLPGIEDLWLAALRGRSGGRSGSSPDARQSRRAARRPGSLEADNFEAGSLGATPQGAPGSFWIGGGRCPASPLDSSLTRIESCGGACASAVPFHRIFGFSTCRELLDRQSRAISSGGRFGGVSRDLTPSPQVISLLAVSCPSLESSPALLRRHGWAAEAARLEMPGLIELALQLVLEGLVLTPFSSPLLDRRTALCQGLRVAAGGGGYPDGSQRWGDGAALDGASSLGRVTEGGHGGALWAKRRRVSHSGEAFEEPQRRFRVLSGAASSSPLERHVFWVQGPEGALPSALIGLVGSRLITPSRRAAACDGAHAILRSGAAIVTGGATGVDSLALEAAAGCLAPRGIVVHPWGLYCPEGERLRRQHPWAWHLSLAAPFGGFESRLAHQRNRLIYALAEGVIAIGPRFRSGGTWQGAIEGLRGRLAPLLLVEGCGDPKAESALAALGAGLVTRRDLTESRLDVLFAALCRLGSAPCHTGEEGASELAGQGGLFDSAPDSQGALLRAAPSAEGRQKGEESIGLDGCLEDQGPPPDRWVREVGCGYWAA